VFSRKTTIIATGLSVGAAIVLLILVSPVHHHMLNPGVMTRGHANVECLACHNAAEGTTRQQLQANVAYLFGWRTTPATFGFGSPGNVECLTCHVRETDPHAVHRFLEPRFASALASLDATQCAGCHSEHRGRRAMVAANFCASCHEDLVMKDDPLDVPHDVLVAKARWTSCLGCHDYHANHARNAQHHIADAYDISAIETYLAGGHDPYGSTKKQPAREQHR